MSILVTRLWRALARRTRPTQTPSDPDTLSMRDWADLPPYHPLCDRAPC